MEPAYKNLTADQGALFDLDLIWTEDNVPVDLTGYTGALVIKTRAEASTELHREVATLGDDGTIAARVAPADLPAGGRYAYHVEVTEPSADDPLFVLVGAFTVRTPGDV